MKKFFLIILATMICLAATAQAPVRMNYQTIVRDATGNLVTNHLVHIKVSIIAKSFEGEVVYQEHSTAMTDRGGQIAIVIGDGVVLEGNINEIDWSKGPYFMRCDIDPKGGNNYAVSSAQQLLSVPYALYAASSDYNNLTNRPDIKQEVRKVILEGGVDELLINGQGTVDAAAAHSYIDQAMAHTYDSCMRAVHQLLADLNTQLSADTTKTATQRETTPQSTREGSLTGVFSVSDNVSVRFSQGNLQYSEKGSHATLKDRAAKGTWRFAELQYVELPQYEEEQWTTHFMWGATGCNESETYGTRCNDWGQYNAISNGGNQPGLWRVLDINEWNYLREARPDAEKKWAMATIDGKTGIVFLPDDWTPSSNLRFTPGVLRGFQTNVYTATAWIEMEAAGAVFLPASGSIYHGQTTNDGIYGSYWSSTSARGSNTYSLDFYSNGIQSIGNQVSIGLSVRLVQEVK